MWAQIDPILMSVALSAFFIGGVIKGTMGFGLPLLAIPAMTTAHSLPMALSIAIVPVISTNVWQLWTFRGQREETFLPRFLVLGVIGLILGTLLLSSINGAYLEITLGAMVLSYLTLHRRP